MSFTVITFHTISGPKNIAILSSILLKILQTFRGNKFQIHQETNFFRNGTKLVCEIDKCLQLEREWWYFTETPLCKKVWIAQIAVLEKLQIENDLQKAERSRVDFASHIIREILWWWKWFMDGKNFYFHYHFFHTFH